MTVPNRNAPTGQGQGVETSAVKPQFLNLKSADRLERLQYRLSVFALALDAVLPDLAYLDHAVQQTARGAPLSGDGIHRVHRLALKLFDLRMVLEVAE